MDMNDTGNRITAVIVVVILIIGAWYLGYSRSGSMAGESATNATPAQESSSALAESEKGSATQKSAPSSPSTVTAGEAVNVSDQAPGSVVKVASVTLSQIGWLAVRDAGGRILGAARFEPGVNTGVTIPLLRPTEVGQKYQVLVYVDDGDKVFDLHKDILVINADGSVAGTTFSAE